MLALTTLTIPLSAFLILYLLFLVVYVLYSLVTVFQFVRFAIAGPLFSLFLFVFLVGSIFLMAASGSLLASYDWSGVWSIGNPVTNPSFLP